MLIFKVILNTSLKNIKYRVSVKYAAKLHKMVYCVKISKKVPIVHVLKCILIQISAILYVLQQNLYLKNILSHKNQTFQVYLLNKSKIENKMLFNCILGHTPKETFLLFFDLINHFMKFGGVIYRYPLDAK
jgi:hypothetical protein